MLARMVLWIVLLEVLTLALAGCLANSDRSAGNVILAPKRTSVERVLVVARKNRFEPSAIRVKRGATIHLVIMNLDSEDHDYVVVPYGPPPC